MINKVELKNVTAMYDKKMQKIVLITKDEMFDKGFRVVLKDGTPESDSIKEELVKANHIETFANSLIPDREWEEYVIPLGITWDYGENIAYWDLRRSNVLLINGKVGTGKDSILQAVKEHLLDWYDHYSVYSGEQLQENEEENDWSLLTAASKELHERIQLQGADSGRSFDRIFYIINHIDRLILKYGANAEFLLESIAKYGNKLGVNLILGSDTPDFTITDKDNQERVEMGLDGSGTGKLILSNSEDINFVGYISKSTYDMELSRKLNDIAKNRD